MHRPSVTAHRVATSAAAVAALSIMCALTPACYSQTARPQPTPAQPTPAQPAAAAQAVPAAGSVSASLPAPPMLPLRAVYRYWPVQFVQFVGPELPYSMIELDVDTGAGAGKSKSPLLYATLTDRATGKRIHYAEDDSVLAAVTPGEEAHKTALAFEPADTENVGSISTLRFTMADGQPLEWRFVQGSDISEQGSGLTPFPDAKVPIFAYRELGGLAGEGTALKIGATVSTAAVWTEYSHPPYFVGYRGAETDGAHTLFFLPGEQVWTVASAPASLTPGAAWELDGAHGEHQSIKIDKIDGPRLTVTSTDRSQPRVHCTLEVTQAGAGWSISRARWAPVRDGEKHSLTLQFATPLAVAATPADSSPVAFTLIAGKKKTLGGGTVTASDAAAHAVTLSFSTPEWAAGKTVTEQSSIAGGAAPSPAQP